LQLDYWDLRQLFGLSNEQICLPQITNPKITNLDLILTEKDQKLKPNLLKQTFLLMFKPKTETQNLAPEIPETIEPQELKIESGILSDDFTFTNPYKPNSEVPKPIYSEDFFATDNIVPESEPVKSVQNQFPIGLPQKTQSIISSSQKPNLLLEYKNKNIQTPGYAPTRKIHL
jgi:hypothetical protein